MYTSGLVVLLSSEVNEAREALRRIGAAGPFTLGDRNDRFLPVVLEADDPGHARHWHEWAASLAGVQGVEVVFVHWEDEEGDHASH